MNVVFITKQLCGFDYAYHVLNSALSQTPSPTFNFWLETRPWKSETENAKGKVNFFKAFSHLENNHIRETFTYVFL